MMALWWLVVRKIIRISKTHRITSLADFVSSRYGKSALLAGLVTIIAVVGVVPYIALQLKAISGSYTILATHPDVALAGPRAAAPFCTTPRSGSRCCSRSSRSCSARATWTRPSGTKAWWPRSRSSRS